MIRPLNSHGQPCIGLRAAARRLGISPAAVRWAVGAGHLHAEPMDAGGQTLVLIPLADVAAYRRRRARRSRSCATRSS